MSIFGRIWDKLTGHAEAAQVPGSVPSASPSDDTTASGSTAAGTTSVSGSATGAPVDVEAILTGLAQQSRQKLDWRHSIVDLMKLLELDSGLAARMELAQELHYTGDTNDSASMNIWLHKQVMQKLADNGGKVPADLRN